MEEIFKHYCTHIFKTGKHMTFERLEYEKVHLTMDRMFVFMKDFNLTHHEEVSGISHEYVEKNTVIRLFKRISSNGRDLTFEEFLACLEKISIIYYNEKVLAAQKQQTKVK